MDEKKKYTIIGKVEIGTDEYRDLIESLKEYEAKAENSNSKYYDEYRKRMNLETENKSLTDKVDKYWSFINSSDEIKAAYKLFIVTQTAEQE